MLDFNNKTKPPPAEDLRDGSIVCGTMIDHRIGSYGIDPIVQDRVRIDRIVVGSIANDPDRVKIEQYSLSIGIDCDRSVAIVYDTDGVVIDPSDRSGSIYRQRSIVYDPIVIVYDRTVSF